MVKLSGAKGQCVEAGQANAMFVPDNIWVTANVKETQLTYMRPGQPVDVTLSAYPDHLLHGTVASVQPGSGTAGSGHHLSLCHSASAPFASGRPEG